MFQESKRKKNYQKVLDPDLDYSKQTVHNISSYWGLFGLGFIIGLGSISYHLLMKLPTPLLNIDQAKFPEAFISERAWHDLKILNDFGNRPTGSYANEILAVDFLKREISFIQQLAHENQKIEFDVQIVSGGYFGGFKPHGMTNMYRNVQNVVVKLIGAHEKAGIGNQTLMLNCHFDSVAGSPGASDDAASCCVMLEILRVLSRQDYINKHTILFLFNGAEETPLQASHGFITKHDWAKNIKAFLNLESVGSGGKEILFQTGPNHPWMIDIYSKVIPHPSAQVAAEEIFHSGVIPSDTDFRIFRDFAHVPGMDFAHVVNGYRYHTKYDNIDFIPMEVLQRTGDNILALTKAIINSDQLTNTEDYSQGFSVFFDFLGLVFISYSKGFGVFFNILIVVLSCTIPYKFLARSTRGIQSKHLKREIKIGFIAPVFSFGLSVGFCYLLATCYDFADKSMSWFGTPIMALGLYGCPAILIQCIVYIIINNMFGSKIAPLSLSLKIQAQQNGTSIIWGILVLIFTFAGYRIGYVVTVLLFFNLLSNILIGLLKIENSVNKWIYVELMSQVFVVLWSTNFYHLIMSMFIPITGRSGGFKNPDIIISMLTCGLTFLTISYLIPLILLLKKKHNIFGSLIICILISQFCLFYTSMGFPYKDDANRAPKPQRHFITHSIRKFYDINGNIRYSDSGFWFREMDRHAKKTIESLSTPGIPIPQLENNMCEKEVFCGIPVYSCRQLHIGGFWLPSTTAPVIREVATLKLNSKTKLNSQETRLNFTISGNVLLSFLIRPKPSVILNNWDLLSFVPEPNLFNDQKSYFVMMTHGINGKPINVNLDLKASIDNYDGPLVDITIITTHFEYHKEFTSAFINLISRVPKWAFVVPSVASLEAWSF